MRVDIDEATCNSCAICAKICPADVIEMVGGAPKVVREDKCTLCGVCADQCPRGAIRLASRKTFVVDTRAPVALPINIDLAERIERALKMHKNPVALRLIRSDEDVEPSLVKMEVPVRHCVSISMAALGASLYLPTSAHACSAAKAALGLEQLPEKVRDGTVPYMHGLARTKEAAARIMSEIPKLPLGSTKGTVVSPLGKAFFEPEVVVLTVKPVQAMWVANSLMFHSGGPRMSAAFAGMQASCSDVTALPLMTGKVNFSLGCYGCRSAGKLEEDEMYVGIPWKLFESVVVGLEGLRKAIGALGRAKQRDAEQPSGGAVTKGVV